MSVIDFDFQSICRYKINSDGSYLLETVLTGINYYKKEIRFQVFNRLETHHGPDNCNICVLPTITLHN